MLGPRACDRLERLVVPAREHLVVEGLQRLATRPRDEGEVVRLLRTQKRNLSGQARRGS